MTYLDVPTTTGIKREIAYSVNDFPYQQTIENLATYRKRGNNRVSYISPFMTFDIEATTIACENPFAFMYHWQACINDVVCFGRTWEYCTLFFQKVSELFELTYNKRMAVYVHYLPYEFMFIRDFFQISDVFAREKRKPIKFCAWLDSNQRAFEFRCSFMLSNMNLKKFCENSRLCTYYKMSGDEYDYKEIRTPYTPLSNEKLAYCYNDVRGLHQCIESQLLDYSDNIATIPLTSTGYVRRDMRAACYADKNYRKIFEANRLNLDQYQLFRQAFRGGNCHASRYMANAILNDVVSYDRISAYIFEIICGKYPMGEFIEYKPKNIHQLLRDCAKYCVVMQITFYNLQVRDNVSVPYIDFGHAQYIGEDYVNDNGRVIFCNELTYSCVDSDLQIIFNQYMFDRIEWNTGYICTKKDYLPKALRQEVLKWYDDKTKLKGLSDKTYEYMKSKNKLNSTFGMMVTSIINDEISYNEQTSEWSRIPTESPIAILDRFYTSRNSFLAYQWGVYVTANARKNLQRAIDIFSIDNFIYTDTDSTKGIGSDSIKQAFEALNESIIAESEQCGVRAYSEKDGKRYYLGVWENDGVYTQFKTLGAKKYAYTDSEGSIHVTVSGLSKEKGEAELARGNGLSDFKIGKVFTDSGRTTAYFNDDSIHTIKIKGGEFTTASNIAIVDTTYTLGITDEYAELLGLK